MRNDDLIALLTPLVADLGLELWGIEYNAGTGTSLLRVYIDVAGRPVTVEDCEAASREISATLDVNDPIHGRYTLEVSSPGIDRPLFTREQFERFVGEQAKITLSLPIDGRRRFQGSIDFVDDSNVTIGLDGKTITVALANIHGARLVPDFEALGLAPVPKKPGGARKAPAAGKQKKSSNQSTSERQRPLGVASTQDGVAGNE